MLKLLQQDKEVLKLIREDPFTSKGNGISIAKANYIRIDRYRYTFNESDDGNFWSRERIGKFFPRQGVCSLDVLEEMNTRGTKGKK